MSGISPGDGGRNGSDSCLVRNGGSESMLIESNVSKREKKVQFARCHHSEPQMRDSPESAQLIMKEGKKFQLLKKKKKVQVETNPRKLERGIIWSNGLILINDFKRYRCLPLENHLLLAKMTISKIQLDCFLPLRT
jgi:hypothetical protein